jgi:hypothetical protein
VEDITSLQEGKISKSLKKFLSSEVLEKGKGKETLAVIDSKLGENLSPSLKICVLTKALQPKLLKPSLAFRCMLVMHHSTFSVVSEVNWLHCWTASILQIWQR